MTTVLLERTVSTIVFDGSWLAPVLAHPGVFHGRYGLQGDDALSVIGLLVAIVIVARLTRAHGVQPLRMGYADPVTEWDDGRGLPAGEDNPEPGADSERGW